jgi:spore coat protein U-like protein
MFIRCLFAFVLALWFMPLAAFGQSCNFSISNINFGPLNLGVGGTPPTSGTFSAQCSGKPNATITICPNLGDGTGGSMSGTPRLMKFGTSSVPYDLYQPNGQVWGSYVWPYAPRPPILSLTLDGGGNGSLSQAIDAAITGLASVSLPGNYISTYSQGHTLIDYGYAPTQNCTVQSTRAARPAFTVSAQNNASCNISATTMSFGTVAALSTAQTASNKIGITCTNGVKYSVGLSLGSNGGTDATTRYMSNPAAAPKIRYGIFQDAAHALGWGNAPGIDTEAGSGTGLTQSYSAYGLMPAQATPTSGSYSDIVVVTVNY